LHSGHRLQQDNTNVAENPFQVGNEIFRALYLETDLKRFADGSATRQK